MTLKEILNSAQSNSPEASFLNNLNVGNEKVAETAGNTALTAEEEAQKVAELDEEGRIFARAFIDELDKIATEKMALNPPDGITPNRAQFQQINPALQLSVKKMHVGPKLIK